MAFLARQLALRCTETPQIGSPTIILIVDRDELQKQGAKLFTKSTEFLNLGEVSVVKDRVQLRAGTWSTAKWWVLYLYDPEVLRP